MHNLEFEDHQNMMGMQEMKSETALKRSKGGLLKP